MDPLQIARNVFAEIKNEFPSIRMELVENSPNVDLALEIPKQEGVSHSISLSLQNNDELHFHVSNFWCEWFPCTEASKVSSYKTAVLGYLGGQFRVLEHFRGLKAYKAQLQSPKGAGWQTVATWAKLWRPLFKKTTEVVVQNA